MRGFSPQIMDDSGFLGGYNGKMIVEMDVTSTWPPDGWRLAMKAGSASRWQNVSPLLLTAAMDNNADKRISRKKLFKRNYKL